MEIELIGCGEVTSSASMQQTSSPMVLHWAFCRLWFRYSGLCNQKEVASSDCSRILLVQMLEDNIKQIYSLY
jgi:hypothetical protein